ncbi:Caroteno-chlorophyll a-c-binding protein (Fragment), partial [Durusdinium trenchii]
ARASFNEPGCVSESCSSCSIFGQRLTIFLYFPKAMASTSRTTVAAAAGAAALLSGASFVSAPATTTSNLRASASAPSQASSRASQTASWALAGVAVAATGRRAAALVGVKPRLVTLNAFENELGVQAPVGFWDPAGFTADGSVENFKRRRQTELKHG